MVQESYSRQAYREQDVIGASPIRLVVIAYDMAIQACEQKNVNRASRAISVLRDALNFDYPDAAVGLFRLYQWVLDSIRVGDYSSAITTLKDLREAWITAEKRLTATSTEKSISPQPTATVTSRAVKSV